MPVAFFYTDKSTKIHKTDCEKLLEQWPVLANVSKDYCTINVIETAVQL
ncbi:hypothetical protein [Paenibacillus alkalitolerans]|nr:hypothetical protein [Paenibacillus alkalitolerans]